MLRLIRYHLGHMEGLEEVGDLPDVSIQSEALKIVLKVYKCNITPYSVRGVVI